MVNGFTFGNELMSVWHKIRRQIDYKNKTSDKQTHETICNEMNRRKNRFKKLWKRREVSFWHDNQFDSVLVIFFCCLSTLIFMQFKCYVRVIEVMFTYVADIRLIRIRPWFEWVRTNLCKCQRKKEKRITK